MGLIRYFPDTSKPALEERSNELETCIGYRSHRRNCIVSDIDISRVAFCHWLGCNHSANPRGSAHGMGTVDVWPEEFPRGSRPNGRRIGDIGTVPIPATSNLRRRAVLPLGGNRNTSNLVEFLSGRTCNGRPGGPDARGGTTCNRALPGLRCIRHSHQAHHPVHTLKEANP